MNYRDLQNISNLSQQILVEGANEEHNVLNRWPYTSPYLQDDIMEKENSEYEKASDAALDARYGYGRASGDKRSFGRAANRSSAAAALRALRRGERSGSGTSREAGADAVHRGWADTARTSTDQTPEKKERRAGLANTPYSNLPDDEKEKDRVSFDAVRATYNRNKNINASYEPDLYDVILEYLITEGYADTNENALVIMANMSEDWKYSILEDVRGGPSFPSNPIIDAGKKIVGGILDRYRNGPSKEPNIPQKPSGPVLRDEPLWDGPSVHHPELDGLPTKPQPQPKPQPKPKPGPVLRDEPLF